MHDVLDVPSWFQTFAFVFCWFWDSWFLALPELCSANEFFTLHKTAQLHCLPRCRGKYLQFLWKNFSMEKMQTKAQQTVSCQPATCLLEQVMISCIKLQSTTAALLAKSTRLTEKVNYADFKYWLLIHALIIKIDVSFICLAYFRNF